MALLRAGNGEARVCVVDDALIDLVDARIDIAIRAGRLSDSNRARESYASSR